MVPRLVNTQTVDFTAWCVRLANGSTVTAADVASVMLQMEDKLPEILSLNAKAICSPNGLTIRPKVSSCLKQSELKARLEARKAAETDPEKASKIDVNRELTTSDLATSDCVVSIEVDLPKDWSDSFRRRVILKRVIKATIEMAEETSLTPDSNPTNTGGNGGDGIT